MEQEPIKTKEEIDELTRAYERAVVRMELKALSNRSKYNHEKEERIFRILWG